MAAHTDSHHTHTIDPHDLGHILPFQTYVKVFGTLLVLTVITVLVAKFVDFGVFNFVVAMLIASVKAGLVALYFMHLRYENPLTWMYIGFPIVLLFIMIATIFTDNPYRWHPDGEPMRVEEVSPASGAAH